MGGPRYSFVIPVFNEEAVLPELVERLMAVFEMLDGEAEAIFVDDGSHDATAHLIEDLAATDDRFKLIQLARNFGQQMAMTAGLDFARGDAIILMDGDLQDPPEVVPALVSRWQEGFDVVYAVRARRRGDSWLKRATARAFNRVLRRLTKMEIPVDAGDFRLIDRRALDVFNSLRERTRWLRGMFVWIGLRQSGVPYERPGRSAGVTKYSWRLLLRLAVDGIVSFTDLPLRMIVAFGFLMSATSFLIGLFAIVAKLVDFFAVPGWASIVVVTAFIGGVQLIVVGVVGLYVGRIYEEAKARPLYVVGRTVGLVAGEDDLGSRRASDVRR